MKLKNWASALLIIITGMLIFSLLITDNIIANIICLAFAILNVTLLTKYSKICER